ncbi:adenosine kinase [Opitutus terrae]|uniref:PfkB domain protein n=1 Tax=Opitutus terrae (strain DSM 11246 / JCM 15787 / PB90-1) TaxID=452637 RepID=B1ZM93_OPITP|nr:adenosine kinase [Opitutus terrae]ACB73346.1 PfkB domain protein [Opitutus terrae PB90-1]
MSSFDLIGVGSPIMDLLATVPESFLQHVRGEKGGMVLVDADEMHGILSRLEIAPATSTGGSSANATFNAARLGLRASFLGKLGNDTLAASYRTSFVAAGVDGSRFKRGALPNARCLALVTPDAQRTLRTCLGAAMTLAPEEITAADFAGCRHAHIEGYLVFNQALADAVLAAARAAGCTVSLDLASFDVINVTRDWIFSQLHKGIDVVFANEDEIRALFQDQTSDYATLTRRLADYGVLAAVKLGKDGAWLATGDEMHRIAPVIVTDVIDTNGAGDAWAAGFLFGYLRGWPLPQCGAVASLMGAETVRHLGPIIPASHWPAVRARALALASRQS